MLKDTVKNMIINVLYFFRAYGVIRFIRRLLWGPSLTIIVYHSLTEEQKSDSGIHVGTFEKHVKYLKRDYNVQPIHKALKQIGKQGFFKKDLLCITFDDGYLDNYLLAYPVLKRHNVAATIFVTAGYLEETEKADGAEQNDIVPARVCARYGVDAYDTYRMPEKPMMSWQQIREMMGKWIEIGSHTVYHPILTKVPMNIAEKEIVLSKRRIEAELGHEVRYFAFPNGLAGDYSGELCAVVRKAGYDAAFTVDWALNRAGADPFSLKRIPFNDCSVVRLAAKINMVISDP